MSYTVDSVLRSQQAYKAARIIAREEKGSYGTQIAEELDVDRSVVSDILSNLHKQGVVEKGERTKAQYYILTPESVLHIWRDLWVATGKSFNTNIGGEENKEEFREFLFDYTTTYLEKYGVSTLHRMWINDFYEAAFVIQDRHNITREKNRWFHGMLNIMRLGFDAEERRGIEVMETAMEETRR